MKQKRAFRYRFYPIPKQAAVLARTFGCARYVYNWALRLRTDVYYERQERIGYHEASAALTETSPPQAAGLSPRRLGGLICGFSPCLCCADQAE
jgi:putative transposase